jgi:sterol desaturase/sphingolipid hydroxylase (fatty acid hydroxylase superfamily)
VIVALYAVLHVYNLVLHANVRFHLGPLAVLVNSPQQHRLHHSLEARHQGRNYAALLSLFDVLGGTYLAPRPAEFPQTGLAERPPPKAMAQVLAWPWLPKEAA